MGDDVLNESRIPNPQSRRLIHVVAGVIRDVRGRILLARRTEGRDLAGLWEFPGGKREPGETAEAALVRELHEELGIHAEVGACLIRVPYRYPDKRLCLDMRHVARWQGTPRGREGQALAWVPEHKLDSYDMPPADRPVVAALRQPARYLVTPVPGASDATWLRGLEQALQASVDAGTSLLVQLRAPGLTALRWRPLAGQAAALCRQAGAEMLLNGDAELADELAVGLHLQARQLGGLDARPVAPDRLCAASCHDVDELRMAQVLGCDFAVLGPVRPTPTHPRASGMGWTAFAELREHVALPIYAIGGLDTSDLVQARAHGAQGVAAIRGLWADA